MPTASHHQSLPEDCCIAADLGLVECCIAVELDAVAVVAVVADSPNLAAVARPFPKQVKHPQVADFPSAS